MWFTLLKGLVDAPVPKLTILLAAYTREGQKGRCRILKHGRAGKDNEKKARKRLIAGVIWIDAECR